MARRDLRKIDQHCATVCLAECVCLEELLPFWLTSRGWWRETILQVLVQIILKMTEFPKLTEKECKKTWQNDVKPVNENLLPRLLHWRQ